MISKPNQLIKLCDEGQEGDQGEVLFRVEPALNRAILLAHAEKFVITNGKSVQLTALGSQFVNIVESSKGFKSEIEILDSVGKRLTEKAIKRLMKDPEEAI